MSETHDDLFISTVARHFDEAKVEGDVVHVVPSGLKIACHVHGTREFGATRIASLFFRVWGGALGPHPLFASTSGYGSSDREAIVVGACHWTCAFGKMLDAALSGAAQEEAETFEVTIHGRRYRLLVNGVDRGMTFGGQGDGTARPAAVREHLGGAPWLAPVISTSGLLPLLPRTRSSLLSVFVWDQAETRTVEVKVNGCDWPAAQAPLAAQPFLPGHGAALLRELAILTPLDHDHLARATLTDTLQGASVPIDGGRALAQWRGFLAHGGVLGGPASQAEIAHLEDVVGPLPADYRVFLCEVQASGAGPGYGLLSPFHPEQHALAQGEFVWKHDEAPTDSLGGALLLAHAGCGVAWLLVLKGHHAGEVWVDARSSDGRVRRVAITFADWYRDWLDALVRNDSTFVQWDAAACSTPAALSQLIASLERSGRTSEEAALDLPRQMAPGAMTVTASGSEYFESGDVVDPCQGCATLASSLALRDDMFAAGVSPKQARPIRRSPFAWLRRPWRGRA